MELNKEYSYNFINDNYEKHILLNIKIPFTCNINEYLRKELNDIDPFITFMNTKELEIHFQNFIIQENQNFYDKNDEELINDLLKNSIDVDNHIKMLEKLYRDETIEYAERIGPSDNEIFAHSFHQLVHSSFLTDILAKEKFYAKTITDMINRKDLEITSLNDDQENEMDNKIHQLDVSTTSEDINNLLAQQYSIQNLIRKKWESEIDAKKGHQKNEYRNWITNKIDEILLTKIKMETSIGNKSSMFLTQTPSMEESFTIHLGSQLKHMHNIRILSANVTDLCSPLHHDESLNGLNIALGLYSSSLFGVVVLTPSGWLQTNPNILKNANLSTEFHFDQIDEQLGKIQSDLNKLSIDEETNKTTKMKLRPGDFFITKHSNLSQSHIIYHLISDETNLSTQEINSRHPVILGLRNILKISSKHDVTMLTIPGLLRHEMSEHMTVPWCIRRAELIFKCAKGFMIESASWGGSELSTLQLLLPHNISEELFTTLAGMVPHIFRVANPKILVDNNN